MLLGNTVLDVWNSELNTVTLLDAACQVAMNRLQPTFAEMWHLLASQPHAQVVARRLVTGEPV
jgi:hypothetical protein